MSTKSRFDAENIERLASISDSGRFEMHFSAQDGRTHVVSLPFPVALALGRLICDVSEKAPFALGGALPSGNKG